MNNTLWGDSSRNFGTPEDLMVIDSITGIGPCKRYKRSQQIMDIQDRWNARRQRAIWRVLYHGYVLQNILIKFKSR